jgi:Mitochondrial carrier protein
MCEVLRDIHTTSAQQPSTCAAHLARPWAACGARAPHKSITRGRDVQGVTGLWRGHTATLLHRVPYSAVNFAVFENTRNLLTPVFRSPADGGTYASEVRARVLGATSAVAIAQACHQSCMHAACCMLPLAHSSSLYLANWVQHFPLHHSACTRGQYLGKPTV